MDDLDLYLLATQIHKKHKQTDEILSLIWSKITKVDRDFSIDEKLNIEIPSTKKFKKLNIPEEKYEKILNAGLTHEDAHAFLFPFMKYVNNVYAIAKKYSDYAKIPFDIKVFDSVENIVSDIINETIIINTRLPGYEDLPALTYYYLYTPNINEFEKFENERLEIEKNPLQALWFKHRMTLIKPTQSDKYFSDILYDTLTNIYNNFDIKKWINEASFTSIASFISEIFQHADKFYNIMKNHASKELKHPEQLKADLLQLLTNQYITYINHAKAYLILILTMYRFIIENNKEETLKILITDNIKKPEPLSPDELDSIFAYMISHTLLEPPLLNSQILEKIATKILNQALLTKRGTWVSQTEEAGETTLPWYKYPRGKFVKSTLMKDILEWKVRKTTPITTEQRKTTTSLPTNITILLDESGSTLTMTDILSPIINMTTTAFDTERAIAMSVLLNTINAGGEKIPVNLIRFSSQIITEKHTAKTAYEAIKNIKPMLKDTNITDAIKVGITLHKDSQENYFIILTDMEIDDDEASFITNTLKTHIRKSPLLIIIIGEEFPKELETLKRRNTAIINIKDYKDFKKIEDAIRTLLT